MESTYKITIDVETESLENPAGFTGVVSYIISQQIKTLPGVKGVSISEIQKDPDNEEESSV